MRVLRREARLFQIRLEQPPGPRLAIQCIWYWIINESPEELLEKIWERIATDSPIAGGLFIGVSS
jgi:hypothetical protein